MTHECREKLWTDCFVASIKMGFNVKNAIFHSDAALMEFDKRFSKKCKCTT